MRYEDEDIVAVVGGAADGNGGAVGRADCPAAGDEEDGFVFGVGVLSAMLKPEKARSVFELGVANLLSVIPCWGGAAADAAAADAMVLWLEASAGGGE